MSRETKYGYGFLLAGIGMPYLIDYLLGPTLAFIAALVFCLLGGWLLFLGRTHARRDLKHIQIVVAVCLILIAIGGSGWRLCSQYSGHDLTVTAVATIANYPAGTVVGGIDWNPIYSALTVQFINSTSEDYDNLDVRLQPDEPIAGIGQLSTLQNVSFSMDPPIDVNTSTVHGTALAYDGGYRVLCQKLPKRGGVLQLVVAIAMPNGDHGVKLHRAATNRTYWERFDFTTDHVQKFADYFEQKRFAKSIHVDGDYTVAGVRLNISKNMDVAEQPR